MLFAFGCACTHNKPTFLGLCGMDVNRCQRLFCVFAYTLDDGTMPFWSRPCRLRRLRGFDHFLAASTAQNYEKMAVIQSAASAASTQGGCARSRLDRGLKFYVIWGGCASSRLISGFSDCQQGTTKTQMALSQLLMRHTASQPYNPRVISASISLLYHDDSKMFCKK